MTRILLVQLADIGDLILTTPALAALRQAQPEAHLTLLTTTHSAKIIEQGLVDNIVTFDRQQFNSSRAFFKPANLKRIWALRQHEFEVVVFFHHFTLTLGTLKFALIAWASGAKRVLGIDNGNGWFLNERMVDEGFGAKHQAQYWLDLVGLLGANSPAQRAQIAFDGGILPLAATQHQRVIIHTGSGGYSVARRWLPEYFAQVANQLHERYNAQIVFVGTPNDGADKVIPLVKHKPVDLVGKTSLTQLADLIRSADVYIGADSGVMHIAASVRTPVIAIFGSSNAQAWSPWSPNGTIAIMRSAPLCSPCSYVGHDIGAREGCVAKTCMKMVTPEQVIDVADAILQDKPLPRTNPRQITIAHGERSTFLGVAHDRLTQDTFLSTLEAFLKVKSFKLVVLSDYTTALHNQRDSILKAILQRAHLVVPCGTGLSWASNWKRDDFPERLLRLNLVGALLERASQRHWRVFLLGKYAVEAASLLQQDLPHIQVVGMSKLSDSPDHEAVLTTEINASHADILLVGYNTPNGEKWLARNSARLQVKVGIEIGDVMQDMAGRMPLPPELVEELRLGWLYMALRQPKRLQALWRVPRFVWGIVTHG